MKKGIIVLLVLVSTGALLSAESRGRKDNDDKGNGRRQMSENRAERMEELLEDATIVTISGNLELENGQLPKLVSGKVTYTIMAPIDQLLELEVKDGMKVTLEGVERVSRMVWDGSEKSFIVTKITINGKTTEINHDEKSGRMSGGMMGGRNQGKGFRN